MALICKKISKIKNYFRDNLINKIFAHKYENSENLIYPFLNRCNKLEKNSNSNQHSISLSNLIHIYLNLRNSEIPSSESKIEIDLIKDIIDNIGAKQNFGNDSMINTFKGKK